VKTNQLLAVFLERLKAVEDRLRGNTETLKRDIELIKSIPLPERGDIGPEGEIGIQGPEGIQGRTGESGPAGPQGKQGPRGSKGDKGTQGSQGVQGKEGKSGPKGPSGNKGEKGVTGNTGKTGKEGKAGHIPRHKIENGKVAFEIAPNRYGEWITFKQTNQYYSGGGSTNAVPAGLKWIDYVSNYAVDPVFEQSIASGDVYRYQYANDTLYRLVGSNPYSDRFYSAFDGSAVSGLVIERGMTI
jgi:hypothetical protein